LRDDYKGIWSCAERLRAKSFVPRARGRVALLLSETQLKLALIGSALGGVLGLPAPFLVAVPQRLQPRFQVLDEGGISALVYIV
jgi:hypothetical protein